MSFLPFWIGVKTVKVSSPLSNLFLDRGGAWVRQRKYLLDNFQMKTVSWTFGYYLGEERALDVDIVL